MSVFKSLDICYKFFNRSLNAEFLKEGYGEITFSSYQYLIAVYKLHKAGNQATTTEIANQLNVKKSSVVEMIKTLLRNDYLIKQDSLADKRSFTLELSEKGYQMMNIEAAFSEKFIKLFYNPLNYDEIVKFEEILEKIANNLREEV